MNVDILQEIEATGKKAEKQALLRTLDDQTKLMVRLALDPDITFGVTAPDDDECEATWHRANSGGNAGRGMTEPAWDSWFIKTLGKFQLRELTGDAAKSMVIELIQRAHSMQQAKWAGRVINRTLRAGFDISTFNKTFDLDTIEKFSVQLADVYEGEPLSGMWFVQPKLDGNRVVLMDGKAWSRNGKEYAAAQHIIDEFPEGFFDKWVVDGEMMGNLGFDQSSGALRRLSEGGKKKAEFTYWVFDLVARNDWQKRQTPTMMHRTNLLHDTFKKLKLSNVKIVPTEMLEDPAHSQIMDLCDRYLSQGFEGVMLKDASSPYVFKRGKNLLKVKKFFDADLKIVDFYEGKGKHKGRLGGIVVEGKIDGKKYSTKVGSGFDDATRDEIWENQKKWMGAVVQVQYQDATKDGSLRFPVFVMRRKDKE